MHISSSTLITIQVGSDLDHKIKAAAAEGEPQWDGIGESAELRVWRIEQFKVVAWPTEQYGSFHTGDSYVVLHSYQKDPDSDALSHDLHIWIGKESSQDEYGTAAYKMVECDDQLGGAAVQHRDVQGKESPLFQSYFKNGIKYLEGGAASGFTHVEPTVDVPHLYRVKGTEGGMSLTQLPLKLSSLNQGDSFIVFANAQSVWVWHGESANPDEKARANRTAEDMCTEGTVQVLESGNDEDDAFWGYLAKDGEIGPADDASDETVEQFTPLLFQLPLSSDNNEPVAQGEPVSSKFRWAGASSPQMDRSHLHDDNIYLLDAGWDLFVWMGAAANVSEKVGALGWADEYCRQSPRTADVPITLVKAGYEPTRFSGYFRD